MSVGNELCRARTDVAVEGNAVRSGLGQSRVSRATIQSQLLGVSRTVDELARNAEAFVAAHPQDFTAIAQALKAHLANAFAAGQKGSSARWLDALDERDSTATSSGAQKAREC